MTYFGAECYLRTCIFTYNKTSTLRIYVSLLTRHKKHFKIITKGQGSSRFVETNTPFSQEKKFFLEDLKLFNFICALFTVSSRALWPQDITELLDFWYKK